MNCYAVIDTNVLVSALLSLQDDAATVQILRLVMETRADDSYLITGNIKHFPKRTYIVTPRQMLDILGVLKSNRKDFINSNFNLCRRTTLFAKRAEYPSAK